MSLEITELYIVLQYQPVIDFFFCLQILSKKKYLCLDGYDEGYFDFSCVEEKPGAGMDWYTVCGTPYPNHVEYICVVTAFSIGGFCFYWQALSRSGTLPPTGAGKKLKAN